MSNIHPDIFCSIDCRLCKRISADPQQKRTCQGDAQRHVCVAATSLPAFKDTCFQWFHCQLLRCQRITLKIWTGESKSGRSLQAHIHDQNTRCADVCPAPECCQGHSARGSAAFASSFDNVRRHSAARCGIEFAVNFEKLRQPGIKVRTRHPGRHPGHSLSRWKWCPETSLC